MKFSKYHGLGNDYIIIEPREWGDNLSPGRIQKICDRHYGVGSDGILIGPLKSQQADYALRIFNPDGSEAEKSGNGLRIFCRYLWDNGLLKPMNDKENINRSPMFTIQTLGGIVKAEVLSAGDMIQIEMGEASFDSSRIPVTGERRDVINENMWIADKELHYCAVTIGNPHCVILCDQVTAEIARHLGPLIENEPRFPNRINVQFMQVLDKENIRIEIWERGAGYTLASGSSSCAAAVAAYRLGMCLSEIHVHMPGGQLKIAITPDMMITLRGGVSKVFEGAIDL